MNNQTKSDGVGVVMYGTLLICCGVIGIILGNIALIGGLMIGGGIYLIANRERLSK